MPKDDASTADAKSGDIAQIERTISTTSIDPSVEKDHQDYNRIDNEVAKYASDSVIEITPEENKRLKRAIDKRVLTIMVATYFLQALDKGTMSFAAIMGIRTDTHLVGQQYSCKSFTTIVFTQTQNFLFPFG